MVFTEKKKEENWEYWTKDVFGEITITSSEQLVGDILDGMVSLILKEQPGIEEVTGSVKYPNGIITYKLKREPQWSKDEDEEELCKNTHTSTSKQEKGRIQNVLLMIPGINLLRRFVEAFRQAWKKTK